MFAVGFLWALLVGTYNEHTTLNTQIYTPKVHTQSHTDCQLGTPWRPREDFNFLSCLSRIKTVLKPKRSSVVCASPSQVSGSRFSFFFPSPQLCSDNSHSICLMFHIYLPELHRAERCLWKRSVWKQVQHVVFNVCLWDEEFPLWTKDKSQLSCSALVFNSPLKV